MRGLFCAIVEYATNQYNVPFVREYDSLSVCLVCCRIRIIISCFQFVVMLPSRSAIAGCRSLIHLVHASYVIYSCCYSYYIT